MHGLRSHIFFVDDVGTASRWYRQVLGKPPYFDQPFYTGFEVGGYELGLHPSSDTQRPGVGGDRAYWGVADADAELARLVALGATVLEAVEDVGGGIRIGAVRDPFGNAFGLIQNPQFHADVVTLVPHGERLAAAPGDVSERAIVKEAMIAAAPSVLWPLWTTAEGLRSWLAPDARVELRIGGPYEILFMADAPAGSQGSEGCRVLSWLPERMLSFTWNAPPSHAETRPQYTWVVVELAAVTGGTHVTLTHLGWPGSGFTDPTGAWSATYAYFDRAWEGVLDALRAHVATV